MPSFQLFTLSVLCLTDIIIAVRGLPLSEFYSFGRKSGDSQLRHGFYKLVNLSTAVMFNGEAHNNLYVNANGVISFNLPSSKHSPNVPDGHKLLAPFFGDLLLIRTGKVFYRETQENRLLLLASAEVHEGFTNERRFEATSLFIVTWFDVKHASVNKRISFQVVLISDGEKTFALFHYHHEGNKGSDNSRQTSTTTFPKAGFRNERNKFYLPNSGTSDFVQLCESSNINIPGKWLYVIGLHGIAEPESRFGGARNRNVARARDLLLNGGLVKRSLPDTCGESETQCSDRAVCKENGCCVCNDGHYGNGKMCLKNGQDLHMTGALSGSINGLSTEGLKFSIFGDLQSKTTFVAVYPVSPSIGVLLRFLTPMVSTFGFLLAHPGDEVGNGFSFLGDSFLRRSEVTFSDTGDIVKIRETMSKKDQNGLYNFQVEISGNITVFDSQNDITFDDYVHTYRYDRRGIISGFYRSSFNVGGKTYNIGVVEVLEFDEVQGCSNVASSKMAVSEQRSSYGETNSVLNFALKTEMQDIEGCGEEKRKCHRQAKCVLRNGVEFCNCNVGFQGDGFSCQDVDECLLDIHDCSVNADCNNNLGSYSCKCRDGYSGDGKVCSKEERRCGDMPMECHPFAQCIMKDGDEICECNVGYIGDGEFCQDADECGLGIDECSVNANCLNTPGSYSCRCKDGYTGDGKTCQGAIIGSGDACSVIQCGSNEECIEGLCQCRNGFLNDSSACIDAEECQLSVHTCDKNALCTNTLGSFHCTCNTGYTGDGYKCVPEVTGCNGNECHVNGYCDKAGEVPACRCNSGFSGDGVSCEDVNECANGLSYCHGYAFCTNTVGSYTCECRPGYLGDGYECAYDDPCKDLSCHLDARCIVENGSPMCQCFSGYYGDGQKCKDYNECEAKRDNCDENARCVNIAGSYKCFCLAGYLGDGFSCTSDGSCGGRKCHRNAECTVINSVKQCQCKKGFVGSGLICVDSDECSNTTLVQCPPFSKCFNIPGSYECRCDPGYQWNGVECETMCLRCLNGGQCLESGCLCREGYSGERCQWGGDEFVVFTQGSTMQRLSLPPTQQSIGIFLQTTRGLLVALDFDYMNKMIYFTDVARKAIWRVPFNGIGAEKIISEGLSSPEGIAVDYVGGNLYWTDSMFDRIEVSKLDGSDRKVLFSTRLINPRSIIVYPERGTMYWADWNRVAPKIEVSSMDGGSRRVFIQQSMGLPNGLALDRRNDQLCWTDAMYRSISCANLQDGISKVEYPAAKYPFGITSFGQYLIWTDWDARTIQQYDRNSLQLQPAIKSFPGSSGAFYEIKAVQKPEELDFHECNKNNGGCSNLCLSKPGGHTCACPNGYYLISKEDTMRLRGRMSGVSSGMGSGQMSGSGAGSGFNAPSGPSLNSTISSNKTLCADEEMYNLFRSFP